ncbi:sigma-70 family RNA polymerase sigma factor [Niveibacterium sp.]|uniref:sigma-70 family RNA polymerase sigma factor n=1 Tax=Niveibacterium sp. TaxID=2017444 RepID=UPI0035B08ED6
MTTRTDETDGLPCLLTAWSAHEAALRRWLTHQLRDRAFADDLAQDVFLKALRQGHGFCRITNTRAWLFEVARNTLADHQRRQRDTVDLSEDLPQEQEAVPAVEGLAQCLPRALQELSVEDRDAIQRCDIEGLSQADFAKQHGIGLSAAKSRVQRARRRLKSHLVSACQVRYDDTGSVCCFVRRATPD